MKHYENQLSIILCSIVEGPPTGVLFTLTNLSGLDSFHVNWNNSVCLESADSNDSTFLV